PFLGRLRDRFEGHDGRAAVPPAPVAAGVRRDREEPGGDLRPPVVLMRPSDHLDENLLSDFLRQAPVRQEPVREPEERRRIALEELRRPVRISPADAFEQPPVLGARGLVLHHPSGTAYPETPGTGESFAPQTIESGGSGLPFRPYDVRKRPPALSRQTTPSDMGGP